MSKSIIIPSHQALADLINKQVEFITLKFGTTESVNQEAGEKLVTLFPSLMSFDRDAGKLSSTLIQYKTGQDEEGKDTYGAANIGFYDQILPEDFGTDVVTTVGEDGTISVTVTGPQLIAATNTAILRAINDKLQLGQELIAQLPEAQSAYLDPGRDHPGHEGQTGLTAPIFLTPELFAQVTDKLLANREVGAVGEGMLVNQIALNIDKIVEEMDLTASMEGLAKELTENYGIGVWSMFTLNFVVRSTIQAALRTVSYDNMVSIAKLNEATLIRRAEAEAQAAAQAAAEGQAASVDAALADQSAAADAQG